VIVNPLTRTNCASMRTAVFASAASKTDWPMPAPRRTMPDFAIAIGKVSPFAAAEYVPAATRIVSPGLAATSASPTRKNCAGTCHVAAPAGETVAAAAARATASVATARPPMRSATSTRVGIDRLIALPANRLKVTRRCDRCRPDRTLGMRS
jgi:hypothetical protein